jgi:DNA-directed RNA polymerase specialized sigma24 family protein
MLSSRELFDVPDASLKETAFLLGGSDEREREMNCLEACLGKLPPETQRLIISYYDWEDGKKIPSRKRLAAELGLSLNSLRIRAHRIREELEKCATGCIEASTSSLK